MSNYKTEVERTDQLKRDYLSVMTGVFNEIKKDDSITINRVNQIENAVRELKNNRKRWASGTTGLAIDKDKFLSSTNYDVPLTSNNLRFNPSIIIAFLKKLHDSDYKSLAVYANLDFIKFKYIKNSGGRSFASAEGAIGSGRTTDAVQIFLHSETVKWVAIE